MLIEIDELTRRAEAERLGNEIALLAAHIEVATARLLELIREFDALSGWATGFLSCAHWLNYRVGIGLHGAERCNAATRAVASPAVACATRRATTSATGRSSASPMARCSSGSRRAG